LQKGDNQTKLPSRKVLALSCTALILILAIIVAVVVYEPAKAITLEVDGVSTSYETKADTVSDFLQEINYEFTGAEQMSVSLSSELTDGMTLTVANPINVTISADWKKHEITLTPRTVAEVLIAAGIEVRTQDIVTPAADTLLTEDTEIVVNRIDYRTVEEIITVNPKVIKREDPSLASGKTKVIQKGKAGQVKITYANAYKDGVLFNKAEQSRETIVEAENRIIAYGTKPASRGGTTRNFAYSDTFTVTATAYTHTGYNTATGTKPAVGTVAVDPKVIPLGTKLYIEGYGYGVAADTGGFIKGKRIDVFLDTERACQSWGRRNVKIYILK